MEMFTTDTVQAGDMHRKPAPQNRRRRLERSCVFLYTVFKYQASNGYNSDNSKDIPCLENATKSVPVHCSQLFCIFVFVKSELKNKVTF